jgi:ATP-binding cassette subfamily B protein
MYKETYRYLLSTYGRNPGVWFGFLTGLFQAFTNRIFTNIFLAQITISISSGNIAAAKLYTLYFLLTYVTGAVVAVVGDVVAIKSENNQYDELAVRYHAKLIGKDMSFYQDNQTGYLVGVFRQHLDSTLQLVRFWRGEPLGIIITFVVPTVILLSISPSVGLAALVVLVIQIIYLVWASSRANHYRKLSHEIYRQLTGEVSDEITNIVAFKSGGIEKQAHERVADLIHEETKMFTLRRVTTSTLDLPRGIMTAMGVSAAIYLAITHSSPNDPASLGLLVLTFGYMFQIVRSVGSLPELIGLHDDFVTKLYPTLHYLDNEDEVIRDPATPEPLTIKKAAIRLDKVNFSYPAVPVFKDLDLAIEGGEQIGIVGLSGAGKSTLANLLLRFNDVDSGSISIDGHDIRHVKQSELRQKIAYVPQEPLLFHRSIRDNIAYFNPKASDKEIIEAAKAAHADEFIQELPEGYDSTVGERGVKLSGGQKQRVAIARAILKKAPIILFDEATSALDSESEQIIQQALPEIIGKQTAIVIAHRLSTIAGLDRIIVMDKGKIIEEGTHEQLLKQKGRYYTLWQKQTRGNDPN